ncbi:hypothetical protein J2Y48_003436 [Mycoplana sp. BE70]|uniref:acyl-CoA dehydrogenase family protein n=1 Tax=Mycoplana sp. BE70 TaxID=2817775 RepID=UPI00285D7D72|nr:acyl-CoA dehydrogenase family protein [Mycoplana sp. BE70]MDR6758138.1 hypothetical protein [Mycoplana sp. BE70]
MGTTPAIGHPARTAALIAAEDEATAVANAIAADFEAAGTPQQLRLELLARSGLLGVSVPSEHGGLDASNVALAEICAIAAETSATLAEILATHFVALEQIRSFGTDGQHSTVFPAALAGGRLSEARPLHRNSENGAPLPLLASGVGWRLTGEALCTPCARHADWLLVPTRTDGGKVAQLLLPTRIAGLHYAANSCEPSATGHQPQEHILLKDVLAESGALLHAFAEEPRMDVPHSLALLLEAAGHIGAGRRTLRSELDMSEPDAFDIGVASLRLAAAEAAAEQAGRAIDAAQIGLAEQHRTKAYLAAATACITAAEAAREIRATFEQSADALMTTTPVGGPTPRNTDLLRQVGAIRLEQHRRLEEGL